MILRTGNNLAVIIPEMAQLAMRYYYSSSSSSSTEHIRHKRFLFEDNTSNNDQIKGSITEQVIANTIGEVNFTHLALSILNNNETRNRIQSSIDTSDLIRVILREIDYKQLGIGLKLAFDKEFHFEDFILNLINKTQLDTIHDELFKNGTLPEWLLETIHPNLTLENFQRITSKIRNIAYKFVQILSKSQRFDQYLLNMIIQQALTPLNNIIQGINSDKPEKFDQLIEIIINNINKAQLFTNTSTVISDNDLSTSRITTIDLNNHDEVKLMLYQWSIAINSMGQTIRVMLKALEQLYCASVWE